MNTRHQRGSSPQGCSPVDTKRGAQAYERLLPQRQQQAVIDSLREERAVVLKQMGGDALA